MSQFGEIEAFIQVAQQSSFTAAADTLGLSRPRVSQLIQRLEERLGVVLLRRTTRRVFLTPEGEQFLSGCRLGMEQLANAEANLKLTGQRLSGKVRINSVGGMYGEILLSHALSEVLNEHPELNIDVDYSSALVDLNKDPVDLVLRIGKAPAEQVASEFLGEVNHVLCASPAFINRYGFPKSPSDLEAFPLVCGTPKIWELEHNKTGQKQVISPAPVWRSGNTSAQVVATEAGVGIGRLLSLVVEPKLQSGKLLTVLPDWRVEPTNLWLMWRNRGTLAKRTEIARDHLIHSLKSQISR
jgi:DNA-binding transcriptional LysR family regulator